jgi:transposase-like protein
MEVARMSDDEAYTRFRTMRFAQNDGEPFCPHCGSLGVYEFGCRRIFKCKGCDKQFSLTTSTIFHGRKMAYRDLLMAIAVFVNGVNGHAALRLSRDLCVSYKTAFVLAHKLREVFGALQKPTKLTGIVEIDGIAVGGHIKPTNLKKDRRDRRRNKQKRQIIVNMRERRPGGRTISFVCKNEAEALPTILAFVDPSAKVRTDEGTSWQIFPAYFPNWKTVNHSIGYMIDGIHTNWVEGFHSRIRRGERGVYCRISGRHLQNYADEFAWREDYRRIDNGTQFATVMKASARHPRSSGWRGYWRRREPKGGAA